MIVTSDCIIEAGTVLGDNTIVPPCLYVKAGYSWSSCGKLPPLAAWISNMTHFMHINPLLKINRCSHDRKTVNRKCIAD